MAEYRTVTVSGSISSDIGVTATITSSSPGVTATATGSATSVSASATVSGSVVDVSALMGDMVVEAEAEVTTNIASSSFSTYSGPHEVTPKTTAQVLETERTLVLHDITVHEVPYWETSNTSGMTAYIASEV